MPRLPFDHPGLAHTVILVRSATRGALGAAGHREPELRVVLRRDSGGKPAAGWDDAEARSTRTHGLVTAVASRAPQVEMIAAVH